MLEHRRGADGSPGLFGRIPQVPPQCCFRLNGLLRRLPSANAQKCREGPPLSHCRPLCKWGDERMRAPRRQTSPRSAECQTDGTPAGALPGILPCAEAVLRRTGDFQPARHHGCRLARGRVAARSSDHSTDSFVRSPPHRSRVQPRECQPGQCSPAISCSAAEVISVRCALPTKDSRGLPQSGWSGMPRESTAPGRGSCSEGGQPVLGPVKHAPSLLR